MKKLTKLAAGIALASSAAVSGSAFAEVSYNVGFASEYYYRGLFQASSSASAGIDYEASGFYVGAWTADVGAGLEYDFYFGYGMDFSDMVSGSIGYTGYFYTDDAFDDTYQEINLGLDIGILSLEYSIGEWDGYGTKEDYGFFAATLADRGFYGTIGRFHKDFEGHYFEVGYGFSVVEIDFGVAAIYSDKKLLGTTSGDEALVFTISKSF